MNGEYHTPPPHPDPHKCSVALPHGAAGWSAVCIVVFPDHTNLLYDLVEFHLGHKYI